MAGTTTTDTWENLEGRDRFAACLVAARRGNREALDVLTGELNTLVWHVVRSNGLDRDTAAAVSQTVWFTLLVNLERINPDDVVGWLITTARREAKESSAAAEPSPEVMGRTPLTEQQHHLWRAFFRLSPRCQELLRMTVLADRLPYRAVADALHLPVGSIGPTRGRCLASLRKLYRSEVAADDPPPDDEEPPSDISALDFLLDEEIPPPDLPETWPAESDSRTYQVSIYLGHESGHERVEAELEILLRTAGLDLVERDDPVTGSWFRRMRARASSPAAEEVIAVAAHALESRGVLAHDATVTATLMQNLGPLLTSLESTRDAVLRVGALLIVKVDWTVAVHQLTSVQQLRLDHQPQLLTSPGDILHALGLSPGRTAPTNRTPIPSAVTPVEPGVVTCADEALRLAERPDSTR